MKKLAAFVFIFCAFARLASAEINVAESIEWQTIDSALVVRGVVSEVTERKGPGQVVYFDTTIKVTETLKGDAKQTIHVGIRHLVGTTPLAWRANKSDLVLFLVDGKRVAKDDPEFARFPYALRPVHGSGDSALELGKTRAYTSNFAVITKETEVLPAVRAAAKSTALTSHRLDVPWNTEAMKALWSGSAVWLFVPADATLEKQALVWLGEKEVNTRHQGVLALAHFRSEANIARLKPLLADSGFATVTGSDRPPMKLYMVRAAVHDVFLKWNVDHVAPTIEEPQSKR